MEDIIYREDAINLLWYFQDECCSAVVGDFEKLPSADRLQGEWIIEKDTNGNTYGRCSVCSMKQYAGQLNYCPNCGCRMKGADDE